MNHGLKNKASILGMASFNLAEFITSAEEEIELNLPLLLPGVATGSPPSLYVCQFIYSAVIPDFIV